VVIGVGRDGKPLGWLAMAMAGLLAACTPKPPAPTARVFATDLMGGAKTCEVPQVAPAAGKDTPVAMKLDNDGGWCGVAVVADGKPYDAGLLIAPAAHGKVLIHSVGDITRVDYTPESQFAGTDAFAVRLLPGNAVLKVDVTVTR
jgi:hypothetical protein